MMKLLTITILCCIFTCITFFTKAQTASPYLVGSNLWYTNPSATVWNLTKQCGVQTIRIGGAEYDKNMPANATILNWVKQIQAIGAEPIVQVSQYKSATAAADLVKYLNVTNKGVIKPVKFWNIGNEPWLQANRPATSTFAAKVEAYFKHIAEAMKTADSTILIYGPDECDYMDYYNDLFGGKNDITGKVPGHTYYYCDGLSWHRYPQGSGDPATEGATDMYQRIVKAKTKVDQVNLKHGRTGKDALRWGIGEYNSKGGPEVHTWGNGQMFGAVLGWCIQYDAAYATSWSMFESGGNRTGTDFSFIDGNMKPRASYHHMEFFAKYFKGNFAKATSTDNNILVFGNKTENQVSVIIMNRAYGYPKEYTLHLNDTATSGAAVKIKVDADKPDSYSDMIGERTTHVFIFRGDSIIKINYTSADFDKQIAPTISTVQVATQLPNSPKGFKATSDSYNKTSLNWTDDSDNELGFMVEREISGVFKVIAMTPANVKNYTDSGLTPQTEYRYRVVAYNSLGKSAYSAVDSVTTTETPAAKAYNGPHSIPGKIEAEDFNDNEEGIGFHDTDVENKGGQYRTTGVDIEKSTDTGSGYNIAYVASGEWLTYLIDSVTPGFYDIAVRTASNVTGTKKIDVYIDNVKVGQVVPNNTGGWQKWETLYIKNIEIKDAKPKMLKLNLTGVDYNINWIKIGAGLSTSVNTNKLPQNMKIYYDAINQQIHVKSNMNMNNATVMIFNTLGQLYYTKNYSNFTTSEIKTSNWPAGICLVSVSNNNERHNCKLNIN